jgi:hypothetical protein
VSKAESSAFLKGDEAVINGACKHFNPIADSVNPKATVRLEGLDQLNNPMTSSRIEPII